MGNKQTTMKREDKKENIEKAIGEFVRDIISAYNYADVNPRKSQDKLVAFIENLLQQVRREVAEEIINIYERHCNTTGLGDAEDEVRESYFTDKLSK